MPSSKEPSPLGAVARGLLAGVVGTAAMTAAQELHARLKPSGAAPPEPDGGNGEPHDPWEDASAPAQVAQRFARGVLHREIPAERIGVTTHAMHWSYGTGWGAVYGLVSGNARGAPLRHGLAFGAAVWAASYLEMVPMGLYEPPWRYDVATLAAELGYHAAYGVGVALAYEGLAGG